jgi:hypothetical protein
MGIRGQKRGAERVGLYLRVCNTSSCLGNQVSSRAFVLLNKMPALRDNRQILHSNPVSEHYEMCLVVTACTLQTMFTINVLIPNDTHEVNTDSEK